MSLITTASQQSSFEDIYKRYSAPLYGMILKISQNTKQAEDILVQSFKFFIEQNLVAADKKAIFLDLLKITIPIAAEKTNLPQQNISKLIFKELSRIPLQNNNTGNISLIA